MRQRIYNSILLGTVCAIIIAMLAVPKHNNPEVIHKPIIETVVRTETETIVLDSSIYVNTTPLTDDLLEFIRMIGEYYGMPTPLILAIIQTESNYKVNAISETNDYGLMQVNNKYFEFFVNFDSFLLETYQLSYTDKLDPYTNLVAGCNAYKYWEAEAAKFGFFGIVDILNMYNRGYEYVDSLNTVYSSKVIENLKEILEETIN